MSSDRINQKLEDHKAKLRAQSSQIQDNYRAKLEKLQEKKRQQEAEKAAAAAAAAEEERVKAERKAAEKARKKAEKAERKRKEAAAKEQQKAREAAQLAKKEAKEAARKAQKEAKRLTAKRQNAEEALRQKFEEVLAAKAAATTTTTKHVPKRSAVLARGGPEAEAYRKILDEEALAKWKAQAGSRWRISEDQTFDGRSSSETKREQSIRVDSLAEGIDLFRNNPHKYLAMHFPKAMTDDDCAKRPLTFVLREGTTRYQPLSVYEDDRGKFRLFRHLYQRLEPLAGDRLPGPSQDAHTDRMSFGGKPLHPAAGPPPILPGRGMGVGDDAAMCFLGEDTPVSPSDVFQGNVGDCWLLSAIACLAEFDFAIRRLFRKTPLPLEPGDAPNSYTVTLWDLSEWKEVDVVVDERLPLAPVASPAGHGLLGAKPAKRGATWVPYLEKALAVHCGGYDKLVGGNCTNAWPLLTGSRNQFLLQRNDDDPKRIRFACGARFDPAKREWSGHANSPHDCDQTLWRAEWPAVGGGGDRDLELEPKELFRRIVVWEQHNFLIGAATGGVSDQETTDGLVDNHAYSVTDSEPNVCGTGIDLLLIRNPWGEGGDLKNGQFMRGGSGWKKHPKVFDKLQPPTEDNGMCWVTKEEFFRYFPTICVCAMDVTRLMDPEYANDLEDDFSRQALRQAPSKVPADDDEDYAPIIIDTSSIPGSPYKIVEQTFDGGVSYNKINKKVIQATSIVTGVEEFKKNPEKYLAIHWQRSICREGWPAEVHQFTYIYREGTEDLDVDDAGTKGKRTILTNVLR